MSFWKIRKMKNPVSLDRKYDGTIHPSSGLSSLTWWIGLCASDAGKHKVCPYFLSLKIDLTEHQVGFFVFTRNDEQQRLSLVTDLRCSRDLLSIFQIELVG